MYNPMVCGPLSPVICGEDFFSRPQWSDGLQPGAPQRWWQHVSGKMDDDDGAFILTM